MNGLMMGGELLVSSLLVHAARHHGDTEIVSRRVEGDLFRYTYRDCHRRARQLANALIALGVQPGQRVATLAWNGYRHLELYYAVPGMGAVIHTINPRLHPDQLAFIAGDAGDRLVFFDLSFLSQAQALAARCPGILHFVAMTDRAHLPADSGIANLLCYEELLQAQSDQYDWPNFDENTACGLCYTSGTTGDPKGVLYSHRSTLLHAFAGALPDVLGGSARDSILPVVPMFHASAWGLPHVACMVGARLVFPGPAMDGESLYRLIEDQRVTMAAGVPAIWQGLLAYMERNGARFSTLHRTLIGGSACPPAMLRAFEEQYGVAVLHAWGMTEMSPLGTVASLKAVHRDGDPDQRLAVQSRQGRAVFGVDMKVMGEDNLELPWDGASSGELLVRGYWVAAAYFGGGEAAPAGLSVDEAGLPWFRTGDVAQIDSDGYMQITDRSKDIVKSGGEWISSIDLENIVLGHPGVFMAACIAARHARWDERPLLVVARKPGADVGRDELLALYDGKIAKWWTPDDVVFVDALPLGATGKVLKHLLRERHGDHLLGTDA